MPFRVLPPAVTLSLAVTVVAVTLVKVGASTVAMVSLLPAWVTAMFLPASTVTVSPALTVSNVEPVAVPPAEALVVKSKPRSAVLPAALIASETLV